MPRVVIREYDASDFPGGQHLAAAVGKAGEAIGEGIRSRRKERLEENEAKAKQAELDRKYELEKTEVEAKLLAQQNRATALGAREADAAAQRKADAEAFQKAGDANSKTAWEQDIGTALRRAGGVMGPFGILNPKSLRSGLQRQSEINQTMAGAKAMAAEMTPAAGKAHLIRTAKDLQENVRAGGFQEEFDLLSMLQQEGKISPQDAHRFNKELQGAMRTPGMGPGKTHEKLRIASEKYVQQVRRMKAWEEADKQVPEMIAGMRQLLGGMPDKVDPVSGESMKSKILKRIGAAQNEWIRVGPAADGGVDVFRRDNDPDASLATIQKLLFDSQIDVDPAQFERGMTQRAMHQRIVSDLTRASEEGRPVQPGGRPADQGMGQPVPNAEGLMPDQARTKARRAGKAQAPSLERDMAQVQGVVMNNAQKALAAGNDAESRAAMRELQYAIADELGIEPYDPRVRPIIRQVLDAATAQPKKATTR